VASRQFFLTCVVSILVERWFVYIGISKENVYDRFKDRILDTLQKAGLNLVERTAVYELAIRPKLKDLLGL
jgi:hypothetical protein